LAGATIVLAGLVVALVLPLLALVPAWQGAAAWIAVAVVGLLVVLVATFLERGRVALRSGRARLRAATAGWEGPAALGDLATRARAEHDGPVPELPEVEALAQFLAAHATGRTVVGVEVGALSAMRSVAPGPDDLPGATITGASRRGKWLVLET